ncbi:GLUG motif-containing protein [Ancylobacter sp. FA202]|uniref:GLUG motif-containing protein n=1 Tax=Ancylobacter sp. FA202 TaxID=1111106 RepID=UPI00036CC6EE|nr:GLUG motif-containing protein [Ancylobacter sp. FA202]
MRFTSSPRTRGVAAAQFLASAAFLASSLPALSQSALPTAPSVAAGAASVAATSATSVLVTQSSRNAIINWGSFSVGAGNSVRFENGTGATLNRVTGFSPSQIDGSLSASGSLYLVNPNGVTIGADGSVLTGGSFIASTHDVSDGEFMAGGAMTFRGTSTASITNYGTIGALGGDVALIARKVDNAGTITAPEGTAALVAGYEVLVRDGALSDGKFVVKVGGADTEATTRGVIKAAEVELKANGGNVYALAGNTTSLTKATGVATKGGRVFLTAGAGGSVSVSQKVSARKANGKGGSIKVSGTKVKVAGTLDAAGKKAAGGSIVVEGSDITLNSAALLDASGTNGGLVLVGGDYQGGKDAAKNHLGEAVATAQTVTVEAGARIQASGTAGAGGNVVVWSDVRTSFAGSIIATGAGTGAGGDAEVSGKAQLAFTGTADLTSASGQFGTLLLDPYNLTISNAADSTMSGFSANGDDSVLNVTTLTNALATANVVVTTGTGGSQAGTITVADAVSWSSGSTLTLSAYGSIAVNANLAGGSGSSIILRADNTGTGVGTVTFGSGVSATADGGVSLYYNPSSYTAATDYSGNAGASTTLTAYMLVNTVDNLQAINTNLSGTYALGRDIDASATATWNSGAGFVPIGNENATFTGTLDGLGHVVTGLVIYRPTTDYVGLFGFANYGSAIRNLGLVGGSVVGNSSVGALAGLAAGQVSNVSSNLSVVGSGIFVGGLVGLNAGGGGGIFDSSATGSVSGVDYVGGIAGNSQASITRSYATGAVNGRNYVGGLAGSTGDMVSESYATGAVTATGDTVGGLVGLNGMAVQNSYATGAVTGGSNTGGLVGTNYGLVQNSYALGSVTGTTNVGGLVGANWDATIDTTYATGIVTGTSAVGGLVGTNTTWGTVSSSYWDIDTTGQAHSAGSDDSYGLTTAQARDAASYVGWDFDTVWFQSADMRPILRSEAAAAVDGVITVTNLHQLALVATNLDADYVLAGDIDAAATYGANASDIWGAGGFVPIGSASDAFTGTFDGAGHTIDGLVINRASTDNVGLFGSISGDAFLNDVGLVAASVKGRDNVGTLVGSMDGGSVTGAYASGSMLGGSYVGGLIGKASGGTVTGSHAAVSVRAPNGNYVGGLIGRSDVAIATSYATGAVSNGATYVGGLVGYATAAITDSYASGEVTGQNQVGGLVGRSEGAVSNGYATGKVKASSEYAGGLIGYATGNVTKSYALGDVNAGGSAGGLIGLAASGTITQAYATGKVTGFSATGGFIGTNSGATIVSSYWDKQTSNMLGGVGSGSSSGLTGLTTAQARNAASYVGWDFANDWYQAGDMRPILRSEAASAVDGVITVTNLHQLALIGTNLAGSYVLAGDIDATATAGTNAAGIWSTKGWMAIGSDTTAFTGTLDGDSHGIAGLTIARDSDYNGLFGYAGTSAVFRDLTLSGGSISGLGTNTGGLVGYSKGTIINVVSGVSVAGSNNIGGLVGTLDGGSISGSSASGTITGDLAGGLVGSVTGGTISNSSASGTVGTAGETSGNSKGGLIGYLAGSTLTNSHATGNVTGGYSVGGLIGWLDGSSVTGSFATGTVEGAGYAGGLVGEDQNGSIAQSYATGSVSGNERAGGLVGSVSGTTITQSYASGAVSGGQAIGGLVGTLDGGSIEQSYALGSVTGRDNKVGGLVGEAAQGTISQAYASGAVSAEGSGADLSTFGGLIGENNSVTVTLSYWDMGTSGQSSGVGTGSADGVTGLTTVEARTSAAYVGWDFDTDWYQAGDMRPILRSEAAAAVDGVITVSNLHQLALIAVDLGADYVLTADIDAAATAGTNAADIWSTQGWVPLGSAATPFTGTLDGDDHTISDLTIARSASYKGLFGYAGTSAVIRDLTLSGGSISGSGNYSGSLVAYNMGTISNVDSSVAVAAVNYAGGLVGYNAGGSISGSSASGVVTGWTSGGLVGFNTGAISDSSASGNVGLASDNTVGGLVGENAGGTLTNVQATGTVTGNSPIGGLVGQLTSGSIINASASGDVTAFWTNAGGLVGYMVAGSIAGSTASGDVTLNANSSSTAAGGLVGQGENGTIVSSSASGAVVATAAEQATAGGLVGSAGAIAITSSHATGDVSADGTYTMAGGLVGDTNATIGDSYATGDVSSAGYAGGLAGRSSAAITGSHATGTITATGDYAGGLVGYAGGTIGSSYATGAVSGTGYVGGLAGINYAAITGSHASGAVTATDSYSGGLVGYANATIGTSYATGAVSGTGYVGGLAGINYQAITASYAQGSVTATDSYSGGLVGYANATIGTSHATGAVSGTGYVGGLAGRSAESITGSHATGNVAATAASSGGLVGYANFPVSDSYATGDVSGTTQVGGLIGNTSTQGTLQRVYATGDVAGTGDYVGGLVGISGAAISNAYATGDVTTTGDYVGGLVGYLEAGLSLSHATGAVSGASTVGGLVGLSGSGIGITTSYASGSVAGTSTVGGFIGQSNGAISQSYALGAVSGTGTVGGFVGDNRTSLDQVYASGHVTGTTATGGLVGSNSSTITSSYWDEGTTGQSAAVGTGSADGGTGLSTEQARDAASYVGWDFDNVWYQTADMRPILRAEAASAVSGVVTVSNLHQLALIGTNLEGSYVLGANIDAAATAGTDAAGIWGAGGFVPLGSDAERFFGSFDGQGHIISGLTINRPTTNHVGLFGYVAANKTITNVGLVGGSITGLDYVGGLVGQLNGRASEVYSTASVSGRNNVGGLIGQFGAAATLSYAYATGQVSGSDSVGGLAGYMVGGTISQVYASGAVSGTSNIAGLIGFRNGGTVTLSFWDMGTSGHSSATGSGSSDGITGLTTAEARTSAAYVGWNFDTVWYQTGDMRPIGRWEAAEAVDGVITVNNLHQLALIGADLGANYVLTDDIDASATEGTDASDIWSTYGWLSLGSEGDASTAFTGSLDGQGHDIAGLTIARNANYNGLFGYAETSAVFSDLTLSGGSISGSLLYSGGLVAYSKGTISNVVSGVAVAATNYAGGLAGYNDGGTISGSSASGVVTGWTSGGLVGTNTGAISDSSASGDVGLSTDNTVGGLVGQNSGTLTNVQASGAVTGNSPIGGLVGQMDSGSITNGSASGDVTAFWDAAGGLVGFMLDGSITGSTASGDVTLNANSSSTAAGGLVGKADYGTITGSSASGAVVATVSDEATAGGLVGSAGGMNITNSSATGTVSASGGTTIAGGLAGSSYGTIENSYATGSVAGAGQVGGLVGWSAGSITASYATGAVTATDQEAGGLVGRNEGSISSSYATGAVSGQGDKVGGLVGTSTGSITLSYASGAVEGQANSVGGLVGWNDGGSLTSVYATGSVSGVMYIGGLVGWNAGDISQAYATGALTASDGFVGGLAGVQQTGTVTASFWDTDTTGQEFAFGSGISSGATGLTTAQFQDTASFMTLAGGQGWDFTTVWAPPSAGYYPQLYAVNAVVWVDTTASSSTYGDSTATVTSASGVGGPASYVFGSADDTVTLTGGTITVDPTTNAGTQSVALASQNGSATSTDGVSYRVFYYGTNSATVAQATLTVTADNGDMVYGDAVPSLGYTTSGWKNDQTGALLTGVDVTTDATSLSNVGDSYLTTASGGTLSGAASGNYALTYVQGSFAVTQATLTVTADNGEMVYGDAVPTLGYTTSGWKNDQTGALLTGVDVTTDATSLSNVGSSYVTTATGGTLSGAASGNYALTYVAGSFAVTQATLTVTADNGEMVYGDAVPTLGYTTSGWKNDQTGALLTGVEVSTDATSLSNVGTSYVTTATGGTLSGAASGNYALAYVAGSFAVTQATLTVTADNGDMVYGDAVPTLGYTTSGWKNDQTGALLTGVDVSTDATSLSNVGTSYVTTATGGTLSGAASGNYALAYVAGSFAVTQATLTVTADNGDMVYGDAVPTLGYTTSGWKNDQTGALLTGVDVSTDATSLSNVGTSYVTTATGGTLSGAASGNYTLTYVQGSFAVEQATLTVTANNGDMVYGDAVPSLGYTTSGWKNDQTGALLTGVDVTTDATSLSNVGSSYVTTATGGTLSGAASGNYALTYVAGSFAVTQATLTVTADNGEMVYGDAVPTLGYTTSGWKNDQTGALLTGVTVSTDATSLSNVGDSYLTTATGGTLSGAASGNYALTYVQGSFAVEARAITVTADAQAMIYGNAVPDLTYEITSGDLVNGDSLAGALATTASSTSNVGTYAITQGTLSASSNYALTYVAADVTIDQRGVTVVADNQSMLSGAPVPVLTYTLASGSLVNGDAFTGALATTATSGSSPGLYPILQGSLSLSANYAMTYVPGELAVLNTQPVIIVPPSVFVPQTPQDQWVVTMDTFVLVSESEQGTDDDEDGSARACEGGPAVCASLPHPDNRFFGRWLAFNVP